MPPLPGWKDVLRPIRDGYRHLFPTPDTGPTPEERARQRELDRLKGFAYFDTFEQLEQWTEEDSDPLQRANTPLLPRSRVQRGQDECKANVILCHDYAGNYHPYEAVQGIGVNEVSYACEYLQFVDSFIYFSHKLVCVPPPSWTNTLHRNGVKALGTMLVEPQTKNIERLLKRHPTTDGTQDDIHFPMAKKLAAIAQHFGFDGYLINIEKPFPKEHWDPHLLISFLDQLRQELGPKRQLIWYDALTTTNTITYQNALTSQNLPFARTCTHLLTNYSWTESAALSSKTLALSSSINPAFISFGIDVWAQNSTKLTHPRTTYGGGGTNTGIAVAKLAEIGLSAAVFAPAWTFEHFRGHGREMEKVIWDGAEIPEGLECGCSGWAEVKHPQNAELPITKFAREWPVGSETFFYTDFTRAFSWHTEQEGQLLYGEGEERRGKGMHSQLGAQSILLHLVPGGRENGAESGINVLNAKYDEPSERAGSREDVGTLLVVEVQSFVSPPEHSNEVKIGENAAPEDTWAHENFYGTFLPLYRLDMPANGSLRFFASTSPSRQRPCIPSGADAGIYFEFDNGARRYVPISEDACQVSASVEDNGSLGMGSGTRIAKEEAKRRRLVELGVYLKAQRVPVQQTGEGIRLFAVAGMGVAPVAIFRGKGVEGLAEEGEGDMATAPACPKPGITNLRLERRSLLDEKRWRLCWDVHVPESHTRDEGVPYSDVTGPFSYFLVKVKGVTSRAYALEWVVSEALGREMGCAKNGGDGVGEGVEVEIVGMGFAGWEVARARGRVAVGL